MSKTNLNYLAKLRGSKNKVRFKGEEMPLNIVKYTDEKSNVIIKVSNDGTVFYNPNYLFKQLQTKLIFYNDKSK